MKRILLGVNFKNGLEDILEDAYLLAYEFKAEIIPVHAIEDLSAFNKISEKKLLHDRIEKHLNKVRENLYLRNIKVADPIILEGKACECLLNASFMMDCDLILIGSGSNSQVPYSLGRSAKKIIRQAKIPVWVSNPKSPLESFNEMVCAIDFSYHSQKTLATAVNLAETLNAKLSVIYVAPKMNLYLGFSETVDPADWHSQIYSIPIASQVQLAAEEDRIRTKDLKEMDEFLEKVDFRDVTVNKKIVYGNPHQEILELMQESPAGLLIMGSHGRGGFLERILGGTVEKVLDHLNCTILVVTQ